ncbi:TVP38/TMEM64 family protein [Paenibacillus eucommiae]|uniref:TVP38/TMEM64 family membrane protein n=1 Tax=Paenibacillus eucommiae TaxID=1355755 RepID=A0ABS4IX79_9BACL|nr:TVP38/TMEM64 family protein [Paenibacillus eucommiae]MBP1991481.1 putative membrane protein YdjX (TVP38/TMEM64 family) [Paenibacillus eucommiae]
MGITDIMSYMTEENLMSLLDKYRSFGPVPGILLTFMKSFIPPLPTLLIVGVNAAVYGLWLGFLYSWIGLVSGCLVTFVIVRKIAGHPYLERWARKPKVQKSLMWVRRNAFSYVFLLSMFPIGPFVVINIAAGVARMRLSAFLVAVAMGKAVMVFAVSYIGYDLTRFIDNPLHIIFVVLFIGASWLISKKIEAYYTRETPIKGEN